MPVSDRRRRTPARPRGRTPGPAVFVAPRGERRRSAGHEAGQRDLTADPHRRASTWRNRRMVRRWGRAWPRFGTRRSPARRWRRASVVERRRAGHRTAEQRRRGRTDRRLQLADVARRREVLVLVGDPDQLDAVRGREARDDGVDQLLGRRRAGGDARRCRRGRPGSSSTLLTRNTRGQPGLDGQLLERPRVRRVGRADHDDGVAPRRHRHQRRLAVGGGEAEVAAAGRPHVGKRSP